MQRASGCSSLFQMGAWNLPLRLIVGWHCTVEKEDTMKTNLTLSTADAVVLAVIALLIVAAVFVIVGFFKDKK